ncbi:hypothetical protein B1NLA3E_10820 [Bacillus sp. 1NLA3E]|nr:hypothetical protein B1NLA3E_10820 [Bacillus sp. 1NLA3E]
MSLFNKEILLQILRSVGWVSIVYFIGLLFALPIRMMMTYSKDEFVKAPLDSLFQSDFVIQIVLLIIIPVLLAVFLFRFLHVKQSVDLMHSLPIRREMLFYHYVITGVGLLVIPVLLIAILVMITHASLDLDLYFGMRDVLYWVGVTILLNLVLFSAGVFVAMMTGISAVQGVLTYIFLLFPMGITLLIFFNLRIFLYGFPGDYYLNKDFEKMSPITYAAVLDGRPLQWGYGLFYAVLVIILFVLALFFYKKRKLEAASEAIAYSKLRSIFKYGVTFCTMLFGGVYFSEIQNTNLGWIIFGYVVGAIIGYFVAEMVLQKTWRVFSSLKGLAIYSAVIGLLIVVMQSLGIYEQKIPDQSEIKSVFLSDNPNIFIDNSETYAPYFVPSKMKGIENIEAVRKLHHQILADKKMNQELIDGQYETAFFMYNLKNGDQIVRQYRVNREIYEDYYKSIYESNEYKRTTKEIFQVDENKANKITITANFPYGKNVVISNPNEVIEAVQALKADILNESYEDEIYYQDRGSSIQIFIGKGRSVYLNFKPSYHKFAKWLEDKQLLDRSLVTSEDIDHVLVAEMKANDLVDMDENIKEIEKRKHLLKITDKRQIAQSLNQVGSRYKNKYIAIFYFNDGNYQEVYYLNEEHTPDFIKNYFK